MSLAFALMAAINGSTGSSATLAYGLKAPSLAGVSPAAARFSLLRGGGASPQRHWPVNGGDGVEKCLHNGRTPVAGRRGVSPLREQRNALGRVGAARDRIFIPQRWPPAARDAVAKTTRTFAEGRFAASHLPRRFVGGR